MSWKMYKVVLQLLSPLHIGKRKIGNLQQTRYYVPGRTLWGALTARIAREYENFDYEKTGKDVDEFLRFCYFYPSDDDKKITLFPWENLDEFEWKYIQSYVTTALDSNTRKAEGGSLHEIEYIAQKTRENKKVYLIGYIFERDGSKLKWKEVLSKVQLGGERTYGWGRVVVSSIMETHKLDYPGYKVELNEDTPIVKASKSDSKPYALISHVLFDEQLNNHIVRGNIEPLVGLETNMKNGNFGSKVSTAKICWTPGTVFEEEYSFLICQKGIWKFES
ncbi:RAMP superfamily CRISPR-associated protein [Kosmotoga olearia]|uniref:CRISPR type III-associated protein domain-containing protein n=1 Tax=Kosmotoga olearia (strain ATCC BAA-1733 / DSM 21960 / TBF 19.5.1) TaxID=521045 RepID=C5CFA1_KOSOT|nr:RAMP superfamily CRISPR-associated protein [Kosmotoga olearia]ACR79378.1 protein of unknown function DUF324 [Kosmotoga olearia TBF 19.5.1]